MMEDWQQKVTEQLNANGIRSNPDKVFNIKKHDPPENTKELWRVLGIITYPDEYMPNQSTMAQPLYE